MSRKCLVSVFFEGTANQLYINTGKHGHDYSTQIGLFYDIAKGYDLRSVIDGRITLSDRDLDAKNMHFKIGFDGCGVTYGITGLIFASGLKAQCSQVRWHLEELLRGKFRFSKIVVNCLGLSRGGIAAVYLAQELESLHDKVDLNLLLFDPVPGNFIASSSWLDLLSFSTANAAMDVSSSSVIKSVLSLYPYEPLPTLALHAPLLPSFPEGLTVEEDACLGCHQGALFLQPLLETKLSYFQIKSWFEKHGQEWRDIQRGDSLHTDEAERFCIMSDALAELSRNNETIERYAHSNPANGMIIKHGSGKYLNKFHKQLMLKLKGEKYVIEYEAKSKAEFEFLLEVKRVPKSAGFLGSLSKSSSTGS